MSNILSLLLNAYYQVDESLQQELNKKGWQQLTHSQSMIFLNLGEGRNRTVDIARHIGVTKQAINRTVNELVELDLINLIPDSKDKRAKRIILSDKGAVIAKDAQASLDKIEQEIHQLIGKDQSDTLRKLLAQLSTKD